MFTTSHTSTAYTSLVSTVYVFVMIGKISEISDLETILISATVFELNKKF